MRTKLSLSLIISVAVLMAGSVQAQTPGGQGGVFRRQEPVGPMAAARNNRVVEVQNPQVPITVSPGEQLTVRLNGGFLGSIRSIETRGWGGDPRFINVSLGPVSPGSRDLFVEVAESAPVNQELTLILRDDRGNQAVAPLRLFLGNYGEYRRGMLR